MPRIEWTALPARVKEHLLDRVRVRGQAEGVFLVARGMICFRRPKGLVKFTVPFLEVEIPTGKANSAVVAGLPSLTKEDPPPAIRDILPLASIIVTRLFPVSAT